MGGVESIEEPAVPRAALSIITQQQGCGQEAPHPFVVGSEHLNHLKIRPGADLKIDQDKVPAEGDHIEGDHLGDAASLGEVEGQAHQNNGQTQVPGEVHHGQHRVAQHPEHGGRLGKQEGAPSGQLGPEHQKHHQSQAQNHLGGPPAGDPLKALVKEQQQDKGGQHGVFRVKDVRPGEPAAVPHEKQEQSHGGGENPDPEEILFPVAGVDKALDQAEQEQGRGQAADHAAPGGDAAGIAEEVIDVVQHHAHHGDALEGGVGQAPPGSGGAKGFGHRKHSFVMDETRIPGVSKERIRKSPV